MGLVGILLLTLAEGALGVSFQGGGVWRFIFKALKRLDKVRLEFGTKPGAELEGDITVGVGASTSARLGIKADGCGGVDAFLGDNEKRFRPAWRLNRSNSTTP